MNKALIFIIAIEIVAIAVIWSIFSGSNPKNNIAKTADDSSVEQEELFSDKSGKETKNEKSKEKEPVRFLAVGDIQLGRHVWTKIKENGGNVNYPFEKTAELTRDADISFANLEAQVTDELEPPKEGMVLSADPKVLEGIKWAGFDVLSLANNHTGDWGNQVVVDSIEYTTEAGLNPFGSGRNKAEAHEPRIMEVKGNKIAFLAYNGIPPDAYAAGTDDPGVAWTDLDLLKLDIQKLKDRGDIDYIIVSMHDGTEYVNDPNWHQVEFAHAAIDYGANLVVGHHPHVTQTKEEYKGGYIMYSLGNFVFDQMWSEGTRKGEVFRGTLRDGKVEDIEFIPIKIYDYSQPRIER